MGTRWVYLTTERTGRREGIGHVVQVIDLRTDDVQRVHIVTLYSDPFQHWWVPIESILTEFSAFEYLGTEVELAWIGRGEWAVDDRFPRDRIVCIDYIDGHLVYFEDDTSTPMLALAWHFRQAELGEIPGVSDADEGNHNRFNNIGDLFDLSSMTTDSCEMLTDTDPYEKVMDEPKEEPPSYFERLVAEEDD